jgi:hypothetical protein
MDKRLLQALGISAIANCAASSTLTGQSYYGSDWHYIEFE